MGPFFSFLFFLPLDPFSLFHVPLANTSLDQAELRFMSVERLVHNSQAEQSTLFLLYHPLTTFHHGIY